MKWDSPMGGSSWAKGVKQPKRINYDQGQFIVRPDPSAMGPGLQRAGKLADEPKVVWKKNTKQGWPSAK